MRKRELILRYFALLTVGAVSCGSLLAEEEEDEIPFPSEKETKKFYETHFPESWKLIQRVKEEEGEDEYEEVLEDAADRLHEYLVIQQDDGEKAGDLFLSGLKIEMEIDRLIVKFHDGDLNDEEVAKLKEDLREKLREQAKHWTKTLELELAWAKETVAEIEKELAEAKNLGDDEIESELDELLEEDDGGEEEDEDDEDEEEED